MIKGRPTRSATPIAVMLTVLVALYVGTYCAIVIRWTVLGTHQVYYAYGTGSAAPPLFVCGPDSLTAVVFAPAHWMDCWIRPHYWEPDLVSEARRITSFGGQCHRPEDP